MGKKYRNLIEKISDPENLRLAYHRARKGKSLKAGHLIFKEFAELNLETIRESILEGTYRPGPYTSFVVFEPKRREIMALPFYDRVVQHAIINVVGPIFDRVFMPVSYACRENYGSHLAVKHAQCIIRRMGRIEKLFCLKMDFSKYFASIDLDVLHREIRRKISCQATLALIETITPTSGRGLPIGNLTSQVWANLYGHIWDRWLVHAKRVRPVFRYMDDSIIFSHDQDYLAALKDECQNFLETEMKLRFSKWSIFPVSHGVPFLGFRIWPRYRLLRRDNVRRAKRKIAALRKAGDEGALERFVASWLGHASHASTHNLLASLGVAR